MRWVLFLLLISSMAFAATSDSTGGGNVTASNLEVNDTARWAAYVGEVVTNGTANATNLTVVPNTFNSTLTLNASSCNGTRTYLNFYFSNASSITVTSLTAGNLTRLDTFINSSIQNGTVTFTETKNYTTSNTTITGVPAVYTNTLDGNRNFSQGYLNDGSSLVFILQNASDATGFNGSTFDYQLLLPTNGSNITYYVFSETACIISNATTTTVNATPSSNPISDEELGLAYRLACPDNVLVANASSEGDGVEEVTLRLVQLPLAIGLEDADTNEYGEANFTLPSNGTYRLTQVSKKIGYKKAEAVEFSASLCEQGGVLVPLVPKPEDLFPEQPPVQPLPPPGTPETPPNITTSIPLLPPEWGEWLSARGVFNLLPFLVLILTLYLLIFRVIPRWFQPKKQKEEMK